MVVKLLGFWNIGRIHFRLYVNIGEGGDSPAPFTPYFYVPKYISSSAALPRQRIFILRLSRASFPMFSLRSGYVGRRKRVRTLLFRQMENLRRCLAPLLEEIIGVRPPVKVFVGNLILYNFGRIILKYNRYFRRYTAPKRSTFPF